MIDIYDIAVILNNALENAIEACCKAKGNRKLTEKHIQRQDPNAAFLPILLLAA
ncbi:MAG: ATP-binding protein [Lachnospiraceae bacterium]|nr:ATP-binding protein [Lachnospiraceae bacterium]